MSDVFTVYPPKTFPGMSESTFLSRSFSDQGVRIRIRKEHRIQMKRPTSSRHSDVADGEDNVNDDDVDMSEVSRRKRSRCSSTPPVDLRSMGSPYYQQSSPPLLTNDGNGGANSFYRPPPLPPSIENNPYELSSSSSPLLHRRSRDYESTYSDFRPTTPGLSISPLLIPDHCVLTLPTSRN
ncbi:16914_t:CDS:2, partial [Acaulospora colombiana]